MYVCSWFNFKKGYFWTLAKSAWFRVPKNGTSGVRIPKLKIETVLMQKSLQNGLACFVHLRPLRGMLSRVLRKWFLECFREWSLKCPRDCLQECSQEHPLECFIECPLVCSEFGLSVLEHGSLYKFARGYSAHIKGVFCDWCPPNKLETFEDALWKREKLQHLKLKTLHTWLISMRKAECGISQS